MMLTKTDAQLRDWFVIVIWGIGSELPFLLQNTVLQKYVNNLVLFLER